MGPRCNLHQLEVQRLPPEGAPEGMSAATLAALPPAQQKQVWLTNESRTSHEKRTHLNVCDEANVQASRRTIHFVCSQVLGEKLYSQISAMPAASAAAGKITGMLLELDTSEVLNLIDTPQALAGKVDEAMQALNAFKQAEAQ